MAAATATVLKLKPSLHPIPKPKFISTQNSYNPLISSLTLSALPPLITAQDIHSQHFLLKPSHRRRRICAAVGGADSLPSEAIPIENPEQLLPAAASDDNVSTIISTLLFIAFVGLSILTIGVVYIAVTDFLQKREKDKFEKEEEAKKKNKKKGGKKVRARSRAGPKGFGKKIEDDGNDQD